MLTKSSTLEALQILLAVIRGVLTAVVKTGDKRIIILTTAIIQEWMAMEIAREASGPSRLTCITKYYLDKENACM